MGIKQPLSTWSALGYVLAAVLIIALAPGLSSVVLALSLLPLAVGTAFMHGREDYGWPEDLDHAGMFATFGVLTVFAWGGPWWLALVIAVGGVALELWQDPDIKRAMTVYVVAIVLGSIVTGAFVGTVTGLGLMGVGLITRQKGDLGHSIWHVLTTAGVITLAVVYLMG